MMEFSVRTPGREALVDIIEQVQAVISQNAHDLEGVAHVFVPHTTAGITINEGADPAVVKDILAALARIVPRNAGYLHAEGNADAHIKASLMGSHVTVPVNSGRLRLGTWQSIYLAEFDGPRTRRVQIQLLAQ